MTGGAGPVVVSFVASGHRSGSTRVAANLAWMLASSGQDVLVLDRDARETAIHDYLRPFLVDELTGPGVAGPLGTELAAALGPPSRTTGYGVAGGGPVVRRYLSGATGSDTRLDVLEHRIAPAPDPGDPAATAAAGELRGALLRTEYDYVLVDGPPAETRSPTVTGDGPSDRVVLCFPSQATVAAARLAVGIAQEGHGQARIIAAPTFLDHTDRIHAPEPLDEIRRQIVRALHRAGVDVDDTLLRFVPIPFHSMLEWLVPLVFDRDERPAPLLAAYEELLRTVTDNRITEMPAPPGALTARYRDLVRSGGGASAGSRRVDVVYRSVDRPWADWITDQLEGAGARTRAVCVEREPGPLPAGAVVVAGSDLPVDRADLDGERTAGLVVVRTEPGAEPVPGAHDVAVHGCAPAQARWRLLAALAMSGEPSPGRPGRPPTAGPGSTEFDVPPCDRATVHRATQFEALRDALRSPEHGARVLITGAPGAGKTELAKEYAHRYAHEYQLVWFVPAHTRQAARKSLTELARRLGAPGGEDDLPATALRLAADDYRPYLLIYDDVTDPGELAGLMPAGGSGHVICTRTPGRPDEPGEPGIETVVRLPGLTRAEARATLRGQLTDLAEQDVERLLDAVGTDPLTIRLAVGCVRAAARVLRGSQAMHAGEASATVVDRFLGALPETPAGTGPADRLADVARCMLDLLGAHPGGPVVEALVLMCAHLSPEGVALRIVRGSAFLDGLIRVTEPAGAALALENDRAEIEAVLANASSFELLSVDWGRRREVRMHRLVQKVMRQVADPDRLHSARWTTMLALSAYAPNDAEHLAGDGAQAVADLAPHAEPVGAFEERELTAVRRWVVVHVGSIVRTGSVEAREAAIRLVEKVREAWGHRASDPLGIRLSMHHADLLRSLGRNSEALRIDLAMRELPQTAPLGGELRTVLNWRGTPGDLRGVGVFDLALIEDKTIYRALRTLLGPDHPQTLQARHNLALSNYLDGHHVDAARREEETFRTRRRLDEGDLLTWWCAIDLAIYRRELGELTDSRLLLEEAADRLRGIVDEDHPQVIRAMAARAVTERRAGDFPLARSYSSRASAACRKTLGDLSLVTQGARLSMAIDCSFTGDTATALVVADDCLAEFRRQLHPEHPFVAICLLNLGGIQRRAGMLAEAARSAQDAVTIFSRLSPAHPWTIAARMNHANALAGLNETERAAEVHARARWAADRFLPARHPYRNALDHNAAFLGGAPDGNAPVPGGGPVDIDVEVPST